jgi:hypothetical protein
MKKCTVCKKRLNHKMKLKGVYVLVVIKHHNIMNVIKPNQVKAYIKRHMHAKCAIAYQVAERLTLSNS